MGLPDILLTQPLFHVSLDNYKDRYKLHTLWNYPSNHEVYHEISNLCEVVIARGTFTANEIRRLPRLKLIAVCGVGYDGIDLDTALSRKIQICNTPDVLTEDVADMAVGLMLAAGRKIVQADKYVRDGNWIKYGEMPYTRCVQGRNVGILGLGRIGKAVARRCLAMNMTVGYHNRSCKPDVQYNYFKSLTEMAKWADYLIVTTPGGESTYHIVNQEVLSALGNEGILVNVGRGTNVDQQALIHSFENQIIAGAALDVYEEEPNVPDSLLANEENLILQPHQASATFDTRQAMVDLTFTNVDAYFSGNPLLTLIPECQ